MVQENTIGSLVEKINTKFLIRKIAVIVITRPETMLGDSAIAIHPKNKKINHRIRKYAIVPLCERKIPIIADKTCRPVKRKWCLQKYPST